jgi:hypothetical protein
LRFLEESTLADASYPQSSSASPQLSSSSIISEKPQLLPLTFSSSRQSYSLAIFSSAPNHSFFSIY